MEGSLRLSVGVAGQKESNIDLEEGSLDEEQEEETAARPLPRSLAPKLSVSQRQPR